MSRNDTTSAIVDNILRTLAVGGTITAGLLLPGLLIALDKPLKHYVKYLDKRVKKREVRRVVSYMKFNGYIKGDYEHGLSITDRGRERLGKNKLGRITIRKPEKWDGVWRLVFYDIPEKRKSNRDYLTKRLRKLGFYQLQKSVWIHPFPCREEIIELSTAYGVNKYLSYIETATIDNQQALINKIKSANLCL